MRRWLAPSLVGQDVHSGDDLQRRLAPVKGNPFAKAGLDLAWWDLHSRLAGQTTLPTHRRRRTTCNGRR